MRPELARRLEPWLIVAIAAHSYAVAMVLLFLPAWGTAFGGWERVEPLFFVRQSGIFHAVVATGYLVEYFRLRRIDLLLLAKGMAVVFLVAMSFADGMPWAVPWSAVGDGLLGLVAWSVFVRARGGGASG